MDYDHRSHDYRENDKAIEDVVFGDASHGFLSRVARPIRGLVSW
jgi:hypothetical protein